jgi:CMP-N,N'-diacetyllegionaminic acid synthase
MNILVVIPARGGSKTIPQKNIKPLATKPLIYYSIDLARKIVSDVHICVSTDDDEIFKMVEEYGLKIPFKRPVSLATDEAGTNEVLIHAISHYEQKGMHYNQILLLQPTSPLRTLAQTKEAISLYSDEIDMVVSVKESHSAAALCEEDSIGFLNLVLNKTSSRRQDLKSYYEYNGAIYVINVKSLKEKGLFNFTRKIKYVMPAENSVDIDTMLDWEIAEMLIRRSSIK